MTLHTYFPYQIKGKGGVPTDEFNHGVYTVTERERSLYSFRETRGYFMNTRVLIKTKKTKTTTLQHRNSTTK